MLSWSDIRSAKDAHEERATALNFFRLGTISET